VEAGVTPASHGEIDPCYSLHYHFDVPRSSDQPASSSLLARACKVLGLVEGCLLSATPGPATENEGEWTDKGDWLKLAHTLDAQSVFFVGNEPVVVLANLPEGADEAEFFNRIWCMARPQILFLAREGELAVYKLSAPPVGKNEPPRSESRLLALAQSVADISERLSEFTRESIESGHLFGEERFGTGYYRADRALVHDLKIVRRQLTTGEDRLSDEVAHSLIGRALFVRYLEDRQILVRDYFEKIANADDSWAKLLGNAPAVFAETHHNDLSFFRVLGNREFTYAFFDQLAADFNGDTFPVTPAERREVKARHLKILRDLLMGAADGHGQEQLFLFAYRFDIIPIELISSIYEEFYTAKRGKGNTQSSYYTPPALVDFLLARTLTAQVLEQKPRITDAACGSGIFLVEAFRRIVRHRVFTQGRRLSQRELRGILRDQIRGIDLNPDAVPVAAFSLYLAYLHYQEPREINETRRLPNLRWITDRQDHDPNKHLDILYAGNAFEAVVSNDPLVRKNFGPASADVVVGNPPWGEVKPTDTLGRAALPATKSWLAVSPERVIGDNELSQAFVHLALELLSDGGKAALLLSSGILFKQHDNSRAFRQSWLRRCKLDQIVNFAHVRHIFFADPVRPGKGRGALRESDGTSPFISAIFEKGEPKPEDRFALWSARRTVEIENTRAVVLAQTDMHRLRQDDCRRYENLWKLYWWGNRRDEGLIRDLERFSGLAKINDRDNKKTVITGVGFVKGKVGKKPSDWLLEFHELKANKLHRYGPLSTMQSSPPSEVRRKGKRELYEGLRLLMTRGRGGEQGRLDVRLATKPFCFTHSIIGCRLKGFDSSEARCVVGNYWSSLARYYLWMTSGSWGMWHDETLVGAFRSFPIAQPENESLRNRIVSIVETLETIEDAPSGVLSKMHPDDVRRLKARQLRINQLEMELDEAVFDLYELNEADRDLVRDMCRYGLDFFYRRGESIAVQPVSLPAASHGLLRNLPREKMDGLEGYLQVFLSQWNSDLKPAGELTWEVIQGPPKSSVLALLFTTVAKGGSSASSQETAPESWQTVLRRISNRSLVPIGTRRAIYTDTFVRAVSEHEILIIKRNEARHWTRSMAREDADATIARAMQLAEKKA